MKTTKYLLALAATVPFISCESSSDDDSTSPQSISKEEVVANYAELVYLNYKDALVGATLLSESVNEFVAEPTEAGFSNAKTAWLASRNPYGQTEAFRFYDGPIDDEDGPEGQLNAWPMDEIYVDYVEGSTTGGLVSATDIALTKETIAGLNEGADGNIFLTDGFNAEKSIATGYHTVEFLLWGQDTSATGPGERSYKDYLLSEDATAPNADRRGTYLSIASELIVDDLTTLVADWSATDQENYRNSFFLSQNADNALKSIFTAIGIMAKGELAAERIDNALQTQEQEDEHSCFSDNTYADIKMNALGIQNVYLGRYSDQIDGPGLDVLVAAVNPELDLEIQTLMTEILTTIDSLPLTFDQVILPGLVGTEGREKLDAIVVSLQTLGDKFAEAAETVGLGTISVELPE
ncbi:MAG: hypothetical protein HRU19_05480 [Pseudobacteriovorax sp.]|nr:hypothetical protein [Pseudobacteriovorax sp.]